MTTRGPLDGVRVIELGGIGPGPHAAMVLADLGADVVRVRRPGGLTMPAEDRRPAAPRQADRRPGRQSRTADSCWTLAAKADVLLDCFRPGTCERLGIGPDDCAAVNPRLIFARITGWGQDGPRASTAGHDINYLSQTGALSALGYRDRPPMPPLNLVADFGGGSMFVLLGIVAALYERERSGIGQVVDAAMVDGVSVLAQMMWTMKSTGALRDEREAFLLDGGAPFYRCYETADGKYMAVGAIEPQFFAALLAGLGLSADEVPSQFEIGSYPKMFEIFTERFASKTRDEWTETFDGTDACVTPVLTWSEAAADAHLTARATVINAGGVDQAAPAPRFSRTPAGPVGPPPSATTPLERNRLVIRQLDAPPAGPRCSLVSSGRTSIARDRHRRAAGSDHGSAGRRRRVAVVVAAAQADQVLDRYPDGRPHHVKATIKIIGLVDKEMLEYHWGPDWVVWDADDTFQQRGQHVEYNLQPEASTRPGCASTSPSSRPDRSRASLSGGRARSCSTPQPGGCATK